MKRKSTATKYADEIIQMMDETKVCLNCSVKLNYLQNKEKRRNRGYCSLSCFVQLPPRYAYIEKCYSMPATEFIIRELTRTDNVDIVAQMIGVYKQSLYRFIKTHRIKRQVKWSA